MSAKCHAEAAENQRPTNSQISLRAGKLGPVLQKEPQHFAGGVGAVRIGISTIWAAAGPGMAASVDEPLLNDHRADLVPGHRPGVRTGPVPCFRAFDALAALTRALLDGAHPPEEMDEYAQLQALVARLYGMGPTEFDHVLSTFPLVADATRARVRDAFAGVRR